jgi:hypothetical protein
MRYLELKLSSTRVSLSFRIVEGKASQCQAVG